MSIQQNIVVIARALSFRESFWILGRFAPKCINAMKTRARKCVHKNESHLNWPHLLPVVVRLPHFIFHGRYIHLSKCKAEKCFPFGLFLGKMIARMSDIA